MCAISHSKVPSTDSNKSMGSHIVKIGPHQGYLNIDLDWVTSKKQLQLSQLRTVERMDLLTAICERMNPLEMEPINKVDL